MSPKTPVEPWKSISADFIVRLPEAQGFDALLVVVDCAKKQMHAIPTMAETSALSLAKLYRDNIWKLHGLPDSIISDRGPQFAAVRATLWTNTKAQSLAREIRSLLAKR